MTQMLQIAPVTARKMPVRLLVANRPRYFGEGFSSVGRVMGTKLPLSVAGVVHEGGQPAPEVFELSGTIKWFDPSRGFGFIVPDGELPEALVHVSSLRSAGFETAIEGARVVCKAERTSKGLQVLSIDSMDNSTAIHPSELPQRTHVNVVPESEWEKAEVKWFNRLRGFGFLTCGPKTPDIFVHIETVRRCGFAELRPGQRVLVRYGRGSNGLMAAELRLDVRSRPA